MRWTLTFFVYLGAICGNKGDDKRVPNLGAHWLAVVLLDMVGMDTVDASEIRRLPVELGSLSHYLQGFC